MRSAPGWSRNGRYGKYESIKIHEADLVLVSSEPYRFTAQHLPEIEHLAGRPARLIDGEMTSWYGPRAIAGLRYLSDYAQAL